MFSINGATARTSFDYRVSAATNEALPHVYQNYLTVTEGSGASRPFP